MHPDDLEDIGPAAINIVIERTKHGLDADLNRFHSYSPDYARERKEAGLTDDPVDLVRTGAMVGAMSSEVDGDVVRIGFMDPLNAIKALAHNKGVNKSVQVKSYTRTNPKSRKATSMVMSYTRKQNLPQREFLDIRHPAELEALGQMVGGQIVGRINNRLSGKKGRK